MNQDNTPQGAEEKPEGTAENQIEGLRERVEEVSAEIDRVSAAEARRWKVNLLLFALLLGFIFSYLYFGIYQKLESEGYLDVEEGVGTGVGAVATYIPDWREQMVSHMKENSDRYVNEYVEPQLRTQLEKLPDYRTQLVTYMKDNADDWMKELDKEIDKQLAELPSRRADLVKHLKENAPEWTDRLNPTLEKAPADMREQRIKWEAQLKDQAPQFVEDNVAPRLAEFKASLPDRQDEIVARLKERAPAVLDWVSQQMRENALPQARKNLQASLSQQADQLLAEHEDEIDEAVRKVLARRKEDIEKLSEGRPEELQKLLEESLEKEMGPRLDELAGIAEENLIMVRDDLKTLLERKESNTLSREEKLELRFLQLARTLIVRRLSEYDEGEGGKPGLLQELQTGSE